VVNVTEISDWRYRIERYRLIGARCRGCGSVYYPKRSKCIKCGSSDLEDFELPKRGRVVEYTIVRLLPDRYNRFHPYAVALIELDDGIRIYGQLTDVDLDKIHEGMEVEATLRKLYEYGESGQIVYGVKFRPVLSR